MMNIIPDSIEFEMVNLFQIKYPYACFADNHGPSESVCLEGDWRLVMFPRRPMTIS